MYSREFLLCCCSFLNSESENQTHLCRTIELSDQWAVGISDCRNNGLSDYSYALGTMGMHLAAILVVD